MNNNESKLKRIIERDLQYYAFSQNLSTVVPLFPEHIHIEPTNSCNLRCVHCHQSSPGTHFTKARGMMDFDVYKKIIDEIKDKSEQITLDSQGEPTTHPQIMEMVEYAKEAGLGVNLLTNGLKLSEEYTERLLAAKLDRVVFSFEGSTEELHERIRRRSDFHLTLRNILYFMKRNCETGKNIFVCMSMIRHRYTVEDEQPYKDYFNSVPSDTIFVSPLQTMSGSSPLSDERDVHTQKKHSGERGRICRTAFFNMSVGWDGGVCACPLDYNEAHPVGDVISENLTDIYNSDRMQKFRQCHLDGDYTWIEEQGELCASCNVLYDPDYAEYDMSTLGNYLVNHVMRQSKVMIADATEDHKYNPGDDKKYQNCVAELARVDALISTGETGKIAKSAKRLRSRQLRKTAVSGDW